MIEDVHIDGIGDIREEPAHDEPATISVTTESGEAILPGKTAFRLVVFSNSK